MRLLVPTWIFLTVYYGIIYGGYYIVTSKITIDIKQVIQTYLLQTGWYVWIIRVFLFVAICSPFITNFYQRITASQALLVSLMGVLSVEITRNFSDNIYFFYFCVSYPYVFVFGLGLKVLQMNQRQINYSLLFWLTVWLLYSSYLFVSNGSFVLSRTQKYPPRLLYVSYALACCYTFWSIRTKLVVLLTKFKMKNIFVFIGSHTIWIYFWHIPILYFLGLLSIRPIYIFLVIIIVSPLMAYLQERLIMKICKNIDNHSFKIVLNKIFIG